MLHGEPTLPINHWKPRKIHTENSGKSCSIMGFKGFIKSMEQIFVNQCLFSWIVSAQDDFNSPISTHERECWQKPKLKLIHGQLSSQKYKRAYNLRCKQGTYFLSPGVANTGLKTYFKPHDSLNLPGEQTEFIPFYQKFSFPNPRTIPANCPWKMGIEIVPSGRAILVIYGLWRKSWCFTSFIRMCKDIRVS